MAFRKLRENAELTLWEALIPVIVLVALLAYNVLFAYNGKVNPADDPLNGSNQFLLLIGAAVAAIVGFYNHVDYDKMIEKVGLNLKDTSEAILIDGRSPLFYLDIEWHYTHHYLRRYSIIEPRNIFTHCPDHMFDCILVYGFFLVNIGYRGHRHDRDRKLAWHQSGDCGGSSGFRCLFWR